MAGKSKTLRKAHAAIGEIWSGSAWVKSATPAAAAPIFSAPVGTAPTSPTIGTGATPGYTPEPGMPGYYRDSTGQLRKPDGTKAVSQKTINARGKTSVGGFTMSTQGWYILGGVVVAVGLLIWWRKMHPPKSYLQRVADSVKGAHAAITKAATTA
jgi:hypothetical protein